ncbi:unnamed protein product [Moneuplotes crassus]|uniref:Uncharacterized protein n=1 Tax=Euplotes crassus TaxID=5936 RepID=A0AAD1UED4_EUPCR|nr:unnamed protein product [Moneuplotes crassus]
MSKIIQESKQDKARRKFRRWVDRSYTTLRVKMVPSMLHTLCKLKLKMITYQRKKLGRNRMQSKQSLHSTSSLSFEVAGERSHVIEENATQKLSGHGEWRYYDQLVEMSSLQNSVFSDVREKPTKICYTLTNPEDNVQDATCESKDSDPQQKRFSIKDILLGKHRTKSLTHIREEDQQRDQPIGLVSGSARNSNVPNPTCVKSEVEKIEQN